MAALIGPDAPRALGVAVSGGSDSLALMMMLASWAQARGLSLRAVTVDHGLRPQAAEEAAKVATHAAALGLAHDTLHWQGWDGQGNLQDQARRARYELISNWAHGAGIAHVALGHTADDQAETVLMRLARGAGVDGLSAIPPRRSVAGVQFLRPLLGVARQDLRDWLAARGLDWVDDPSNADTRFDRIKARRALDMLAPLGLNRAALAQVAQNMAEARRALNWFTYLSARDQIAFVADTLVFEPVRFRTLPDEIQRRLLSHCLRWISGAEYPPRRRPLEHMMAALQSGQGMTLHGCRLTPHRGRMHLAREWQAVAGQRSDPGTLWDGRWRFVGPADQRGLHVAALGEAGLMQCPNWREARLPYAAMLACPAVWAGDIVLACPLAGQGRGWRQVLAQDSESFFAALMLR